MADLTVALAGCGSMGQVHLGCWVNLIGVKISAICDANEVALTQTAAQYDGVAAFVDVREMLSAGPFDIVDVCAPLAQRAAVIEAALRAGSHVLSEKPFAPTAEQSRFLADLAEERERLLMPAFVHRFHPPLLFAQEMLENDDIGRPIMFRARFSGYWDEAESEREGNVLTDTASNGIDLFRAFCGEVKSITGKLATVRPDLSVSDTAALLLESESGALGVIEASWTSPGGRTIVEIYGTAGACIVDYDAGILRYQNADSPLWQQREEGGPNRFERLIAHFADAVRGLQPPILTGTDGAKVAELCETVMNL